MQGALVQRARTMQEVDKVSDGIDRSFLEVFKGYVRHARNIESREEISRAIEDGHICIETDRTWVVTNSLVTALDSVILVADLSLHLLRNQTDFPFIFSDAPVVFCNTHYRNVEHRGVLGLQTPGLQIFFPLDPRTLLLLMDDAVYFGAYRNHVVVDITERSDVSQLNALQLHHSLNSVYFGHDGDAEYVSDLWRAHRSTIVPPREEFKMRHGWLVDNKPVKEVLHSFEPHLNFRLSLSFIQCNPIRASEYKFSRRSQELVEDHERIIVEREREFRRAERLVKRSQGSR